MLLFQNVSCLLPFLSDKLRKATTLFDNRPLFDTTYENGYVYRLSKKASLKVLKDREM